MRRGCAALLLSATLALAAPAVPAEPGLPRIAAARYAEPATRYGHDVLGPHAEWGALLVDTAAGPDCADRDTRTGTLLMRLPARRVFEDWVPRLADLDGDGRPEVVTVESDLVLGARISVWDTHGVVAATPFIGQRNRWISPVGIGDLDDDGMAEIVAVDRPHLAHILRVWRFEAGALVEVAAAQGHSNHRIGEGSPAGGLRDCGTLTEIVTASPDWRRILVTAFVDDGLVTRDAGAYGQEDMIATLRCLR